MYDKNELAAGWKRVREDAIESGRAFWLAGLGVVSTVDQGSRELLDSLISRGEKLESRETAAFKNLFQENRERARKLGRDVEDRVEREISTTLGRFGIPRRNEVRELIDRIEHLTSEVESLGQTGAR